MMQRGTFGAERLNAGLRDAREPQPVDVGELRNMLATLKLALETFDASTMNNITDILLSQRLADDVNDLVQSISKNILMAEYSESLAQTESLLARLP